MNAVALSPRQSFLHFGAEDHIDLLHGGHKDRICIATKNGEEWNQQLHKRENASSIAFELSGDSDINVYVSQSGFGLNSNRTVENVTHLPAMFVDLDTYNFPHLAGITLEEMVDKAIATYPWLPLPTLVFNSGRGMYFVWVFSSPLPKKDLPHWQQAEDSLVELFKPFGADSKARDAARVLRVVGSTNTKNGERVEGYRAGQYVAFDKVKQLLLAHKPVQKPRLVQTSQELVLGETQPVRRESLATESQKRQYVVPYQLAYDRMQDCHAIARLRGSPSMTDYRERLLYLYAAFGAWYWSSIEQARQELREFSRQHFDEHYKYTDKLVTTVLDRMEQGKQGVVGIWNGHKVDRRYQFRNKTIIAELGITPQEQTKLKTIISSEEVDRRREERRRDAGMVDYAKRTKDRLNTVRKGLERGLTQQVIATELGISRQAVSNLMKKLNGLSIERGLTKELFDDSVGAQPNGLRIGGEG